ncbi:MAG: DUF2851 family protein [Bacteroidales bacterium]|nr:DUF2851 family protein [Bacteroidales bacterium]
MTEAFLYYLWKNRLFDFLNVRTTSGVPLQIVAPGFQNFDAGPDFKQAVIRIGDLTWAGDVEIHVRSSDWFRHNHQHDGKYKSVVLHVVFEHDAEVERAPGECFPTLELNSYVPPDMWQQYQHLTESLELLPCRRHLAQTGSLRLRSVISSMAMERLLRKQEEIMETHAQCRADWNETLYRHLAIGFGFKTNATAFELLARSIPYRILARHLDSRVQVQALLFGQAGMLSVPCPDTYYNSLKYEYDYLSYKYQLDPIGEHHWNRLRLRPSNFPCLRLAQFANFIMKSPDLLQEMLNLRSVEQCRQLLSVEADEYWTKHFQFGKETILPHSIAMGVSSIDSLIVNVVVPVLFAYYRFSGVQDRLESTVAMLEQLPFEDNKITRFFRDTPFPQETALDSQALIELLQRFCKEKRCIDCAVGEYIVRKAGE